MTDEERKALALRVAHKIDYDMDRPTHEPEPMAQIILFGDEANAIASMLREVGGWNFDMDSAPRDATVIVAVSPTETNATKNRAPFTIQTYIDASGTFCDSGTWRPDIGINGEFWRAYAWRPLPQPPAEEGK